ncbi:uncharacterized protein LOC133186973 [Saccostrea echinata]|uniref:uncharacterized protein LOC133186973 n=1 Tax=Saccostrea echinata TaxID=191078 RepID=UPI002A7F1B85|nr:uncharacterized protein LOC133186973 [Saccostrea echinata]
MGYSNFNLQTCLLLDKLVTTNPKLPSDGTWLYFVKASECPISWEMNGKNKYCFVKNSLPWTSAKDSCISMGAHLLAIETEAEQTWINVKASGYAWWIGGTDTNSENTYYWEHTNDMMNFSNWDDGQPNGAQDENCAHRFRKPLKTIIFFQIKACVDKINNCANYGRTSCLHPYEEWARDNCPLYCGICNGPPTTETPCADTRDDCDTYGKNICQDVKYAPWVLDNCRYYCRQCTDGQLAVADSKTTTLPPPPCVNKLGNCERYGKDVCNNPLYAPWAKDNCRYFCRQCTREQLDIADSKTTTTTVRPTPGLACVDMVPHCDVYGDSVCTSADYRSWAEANCRAYCKICTPSASAKQIDGFQMVPAGKRGVE